MFVRYGAQCFFVKCIICLILLEYGVMYYTYVCIKCIIRLILVEYG